MRMDEIRDTASCIAEAVYAYLYIVTHITHVVISYAEIDINIFQYIHAYWINLPMYSNSYNSVQHLSFFFHQRNWFREKYELSGR